MIFSANPGWRAARLLAAVLTILPLACGEENENSDGESDDDVIRSCNDFDLDGHGEPVAFETLRCGDREIIGRSGADG
jgi:hypothetical protein